MSMLLLSESAGGVVQPVTAIEDVFSAYTYTGNGSTQTITNGIDLAGKGGMVWFKCRDAAVSHLFCDSVRGTTKYLKSNTTDSNITEAAGKGLTAFNTTGFNLGTDVATSGTTNGAGLLLASWSFAQANKFFKVAQVVVSGSNQTVDLSSLGTVGMVAVKRTDSTSAWYTLHRSNTAGKICYLNTTAAETTDGSITLSGTTLTLVQSVIGNGTFIVYAWAHDTSATGLIQCGTFTTDGSGNASVNLGWEPQYLDWKNIGGVENWYTADTTRQWSITNTLFLSPNTSGSEGTSGGAIGNPTATGFTVAGFTASKTFIYLAIRRGPMKLPTVGTQVYNAIARTGTGAAATVTGVGFPPDLILTGARNATGASGTVLEERLRGASNVLQCSAVNGEATGGADISSFNMDGVALGTGSYTNVNTATYINWFLRRWPTVVDEICYTGTGTAKIEAHNLTVAPEMMLIKRRDGSTAWAVWHSGIPNTDHLVLNTTAATSNSTDSWNNINPTSAAINLGTNANTNGNTFTYDAVLIATLAGISKVGSYTGNGSALTLNMGFSAGARFFMCKRTDSTGDWFVWDSTRGIVASSDPHLSLNTTAAEVTTDDSVDPDSSGIIVNEVAATHINVNGGTYIYLSFS